MSAFTWGADTALRAALAIEAFFFVESIPRWETLHFGTSDRGFDPSNAADW